MILMVVDDDRLNLEVAREHLNTLYPDALVLLCQNPLDVPDLLARHDVDILFLDIVMPQRDGMEVLADIRADERYNDMPILMLTSMTDMTHFSTCFDRGANDYVGKPIVLDEFKARLKAAVQSRRHMKLIREMYRQAKVQNADLRRLNAQLRDAQFHLVQQEKLASIGGLAAGIAHEINNPIGFVSGNAETLHTFMDRLREAYSAQHACLVEIASGSALMEEHRNRIAETFSKTEQLRIPFVLHELDASQADIRKGLDRVTKIVQSLMRFARTDNQEGLEICQLDDILDEAVLLATTESHDAIDFRRERGDVHDVRCSRPEIGQVALNLLLNAIQAILGQHRTDRGTIALQTSQDGDGVLLIIEDDGPGIPEDRKARIFDPFYSTKEVGQGVGLGLSISHDIIVRKHHGTFTLEDRPGGGARFVIRLPEMGPEQEG